MFNNILNYITNFFKWNTKITARSPEVFLLKIAGYWLLVEMIYRSLAVIDLFLVKQYHLVNAFYTDGMFYLRGFLWFYLMFCTFNKLKITLNKKWNYVIVPILVFMVIKWICPYFCYKLFGIHLYIIARRHIFVVLTLCFVLYIWLINNKDIKHKFKRTK